MSLTKVSYSMVEGAVLNVLDFGAFNNESNAAATTSAIQAAFDKAQTTGQAVYFPAGIYLVTSVAQNHTSGFPVSIFGDGMRKSIIKKSGTSLDPVLSFTSTTNLFGFYQTITDISIYGNAGGSQHTGIKFDTWAAMTARNLQVQQCYIGVQGLGLLSSTFNDCEILSNGQGYRFDKSGSIYANAIKIIGGRINSNYQRAINFDYGSGLHLYGVNIEQNGTAGNLNFGGIFIGGNVSAETGVSEFSFDGCWFEGNFGTSIRFETLVTGTLAPVISFTNNVLFIGELVSGVGYGLIVNSGRQLTVENSVIAGLNAGSLTATVNYLKVSNSIISVVNNNATIFKIFGVTTFSGELNVEMVGGTKTNNNAPAGFVGEYVESIVAPASAVALVNATWKTVTSISLSAGDWDVTSSVGLSLAGSTTLTYFQSNISSATDNPGLDENRTSTPYPGTTLSVNPKQVNVTTRYSVSVNTTVYLTAIAGFGVSTCSAYGIISARRVR